MGCVGDGLPLGITPIVTGFTGVSSASASTAFVDVVIDVGGYISRSGLGSPTGIRIFTAGLIGWAVSEPVTADTKRGTEGPGTQPAK